MSNYNLRGLFAALCLCLFAAPAWCGVEGSLSGQVLDNQGVAVSGAQVTVASPSGRAIQSVSTTAMGDFNVFPLDFGDYQVSVQAPGFLAYNTTVHVSSGNAAQLVANLLPVSSGNETVLKVTARRHLVSEGASESVREVTSKDIAVLPQGETIPLPRLLYLTNPGMVQGAFNQVFTRGNHANLQYQIDGVQLPDSLSGSFGDAFAPLNIDRMEVITGGIPAEYGNRLAGVVNIVTKSGAQEPGGALDLNYGTYNQWSPFLTYGGSDPSGAWHYFLSANYNQTDRGLDTPEPASESDQTQGGREVVHDFSNGNNEFAKVDWLMDNFDKLSFIVFNEQRSYQIPNYPSSFKPTDAFFADPNFTDEFGNGPFTWTPPNTNDVQTEANDYAELVWKHTYSNQGFLQIAPYWKYSSILFQNDPANDLAITAPPYNGTANSFYENRRVNNEGLKADYTLRLDDRNLIKVGFQGQVSQASGPVSVQAVLTSGGPVVTSQDNSVDTGVQEGAYVQDDIQITKDLVFNAGLRYDAVQFVFADAQSFDYLLQPRLGLSYMATDQTKIHLFYGRLFMPAPAEDLRDAFNNLGSGQLTPFDIKAEKDDYYEAGVAQQLGQNQVISVNTYYKDAVNMLDDIQLLNTAIAQPYNFATGYAYGTEVSLNGSLGWGLTDFLNYSYEMAQGQGISGGIFAFPAGTPLTSDYQVLDHVQLNTVNAGLNYILGGFWATVDGIYGSGLRTGPNNSGTVPQHFTMDVSLGYGYDGGTWLTRGKISLDVLNVFDNIYPITVANGFNGSHYAAGRQFIIHLTKDL